MTGKNADFIWPKIVLFSENTNKVATELVKTIHIIFSTMHYFGNETFQAKIRYVEIQHKN